MKRRQRHDALYIAIGEEWIRLYRIRKIVAIETRFLDEDTHIKYRLPFDQQFVGLAIPEKRHIHTRWPTNTPDKLFILAHEIGHVAMAHNSSIPIYVEEFEAEMFAISLFRRYRLRLTASMIGRARRNVRYAIGCGLARGLAAIDNQIARWSGRHDKAIGGRVSFYNASMRRVQYAIDAVIKGSDYDN